MARLALIGSLPRLVRPQSKDSEAVGRVGVAEIHLLGDKFSPAGK